MKIPMSFQSFRKTVFENHAAHSTTRSIFWHPFFARGLAQTPAEQRNKMHHTEKCTAQGDSTKVVEEECLARALAHNISQQTTKLLFLQNNLHLRTHSLSIGHLTLWRWLCELASWLGLTSWLLEWSPGTGFLGPRFRCRFLRCLALGDLRFLLLFFLALLQMRQWMFSSHKTGTTGQVCCAKSLVNCSRLRSDTLPLTFSLLRQRGRQCGLLAGTERIMSSGALMFANLCKS